MIGLYWTISSIEFIFWSSLSLGIISDEIGARQYFPYDWLNDRNKDWMKSSVRQHNDGATDHEENYISEKGMKTDLSGNFTVMNLSKNDRSNIYISNTTTEISGLIELRKPNGDSISNLIRSKRDELNRTSTRDLKFNLKLLQKQKEENQRFPFNSITNLYILNKSDDIKTFDKSENTIRTIRNSLKRNRQNPYKDSKIIVNKNKPLKYKFTKRNKNNLNFDLNKISLNINNTLKGDEKNNRRKFQFNNEINKGIILNSNKKNKIVSKQNKRYKVKYDNNKKINSKINKNILDNKFVFSENQSEVNSIISNIVHFLNNSTQQDTNNYLNEIKTNNNNEKESISTNRNYIYGLNKNLNPFNMDVISKLNNNSLKRNKKIKIKNTDHYFNNKINYNYRTNLNKSKIDQSNKTNKSMIDSELNNRKKIKSTKTNSRNYLSHEKSNKIKMNKFEMTSQRNYNLSDGIKILKYDSPIIINKNKNVNIKIRKEKGRMIEKSVTSFDFESEITVGSTTILYEDTNFVIATTNGDTNNNKESYEITTDIDIDLYDTIIQDNYENNQEIISYDKLSKAFNTTEPVNKLNDEIFELPQIGPLFELINQVTLTKEIRKYLNRKEHPVLGEPYPKSASFEYNRINKNIQKDVKKYFERYFRCVQLQKSYLDMNTGVGIESMEAYLGNTVVLHCYVCLNPRYTMVKAKWYFIDNINQLENSTEILDDSRRIISDQDDSLTIYYVKESDQGFYYCSLQRSSTTTYMLTILEDNEPSVMIHEETEKLPAVQPMDGLVMSTVWKSWSKCTKCGNGHVGRKESRGFCRIWILDQNIVLPTQDAYILRVFKKGIPCRSKLLSGLLKEHIDIQKRPNEYHITYCKESCEEKLFILKDASGKIIETANNSAGVYSSLQGAPPLPPQVERVTVLSKTGETVHLRCPSHINAFLPHEWYSRTSPIFPVLQASKTNRRIFHDEIGRLVIRNVRVTDSGVYPCKQGDSVAGVIELLVIESTRITYATFHVCAIILIYILIIILILSFRLMKRRKIIKTI